MTTLDQRITTLRAKLETLEAEKKDKERVARVAERQRARKAENQRKFELGGLLKVAGLFECDKGALLGAMLRLPPMLADPIEFAECKRSGDELLARRESERRAMEGASDGDASYLQ